MADATRMLRATVLAAPLGALAWSAQAADIVSTIKEQQQFSTLAKAIESAGITQSLQGEGPYTVFAPTDQAFEQLPQGALEELMKQESQDQLKSLLQYHVVDGQKITSQDAIGKQTDVDTASGGQLSVDGTGMVVMLVPTGLTVTRIGDQVHVERDVTAVTAPAVEVAPAAGGQQNQTSQSGGSGQQQTAASSQPQQQSEQQGGTRTQTTQQSGMPASEHQQQVLAGQPSTEQQQTMPQDQGMPSSPHQEQVLRGQQPGEQQPPAQQSQTGAQGSNMPSSPHQERVLQGRQQAGTQQQASPQDGDMPSSPHQEQVLRGQQGEQGILRQATLVEPDIQADNGVIHAIDAVLIPRSALSVLETAGGQQGQGGETGQNTTQRSSDKQS